MSDIVTLTVNNKSYEGWKTVRIEAGVERLARSFEVSVTEIWPGSGDQRRQIKPGDLCELRIGDDLICTGHVDATPITYDSHAITIMIRGRSRTADLVDSSAASDSGQFKGLTVEAIASKLSKPFGITVLSQVETGVVISDHQIQPGESVFASLDRVAKARQILITDDADGNVVLTSPGGGGAASSAIELGVNVLSANAGFDYSDVYSKYQVKGQRSGSDNSYGTNASQSLGTAVDGSIARTRLLIIRQQGQADSATCQARANYEQQIRIAKAGELRYRVVGWRQQDGALWQCNQTIKINDAIMSLENKELIVSEVNFTLDESGMITEMVVIAPSAFATEPETLRKKSVRKIKATWID